MKTEGLRPFGILLHTREDVKLMMDTGLDVYRFSISSSRLIPNGRGPVNPKGLQYYNNLIDELIIHGRTYADVCFGEFGDRVSYWTTVNEPNILAVGGYDIGITPPKRCSARNKCYIGNSSTEPYMVVHNVLLAHASVARLYKKKYQVISKIE